MTDPQKIYVSTSAAMPDQRSEMLTTVLIKYAQRGTGIHADQSLETSCHFRPSSIPLT